jgi:hypothetical protein
MEDNPSSTWLHMALYKMKLGKKLRPWLLDLPQKGLKNESTKPSKPKLAH